MDTTNADYDAAWKQAIVRYVVDFASLFLGEAWRGAPVPESLDAELVKCARDGRGGVRRVDKLLRACGPDGEPCLWHIEVQVARQRHFAERMLVCHYRLYDHFQLPVRSIAILGDPSPTWRPSRIELVAGRPRLFLEFEAVKLRDFDERLAELLLSDNICAWLVVAHLLTLRTRREPVDRMLVKASLLTGLRACGWEEHKYLDAVDLVQRMMTLPPHLQAAVDEQQQILEGGAEMAWKYLWEERAEERGMQRGMALGIEKGQREGRNAGWQAGREEGRVQGREEGREEGRMATARHLLFAQLGKRFGALDEAVKQRIETATMEDLERWCLAVVTARTVDEVF